MGESGTLPTEDLKDLIRDILEILPSRIVQVEVEDDDEDFEEKMNRMNTVKHNNLSFKAINSLVIDAVV